MCSTIPSTSYLEHPYDETTSHPFLLTFPSLSRVSQCPQIYIGPTFAPCRTTIDPNAGACIQRPTVQRFKVPQPQTCREPRNLERGLTSTVTTAGI